MNSPVESANETNLPVVNNIYKSVFTLDAFSAALQLTGGEDIFIPLELSPQEIFGGLPGAPNYCDCCWTNDLV